MISNMQKPNKLLKKIECMNSKAVFSFGISRIFYISIETRIKKLYSVLLTKAITIFYKFLFRLTTSQDFQSFISEF